jgi:site-specific recombinase XerD
MIKLQQLTGMRPGEVVLMRRGDIDRRGEVWKYTPKEHKNEHHGLTREIAIGPRAQEILKPFLDNREAHQFCFSPAEAELARNQTKKDAHAQDYRSPSRLVRDARRARREAPWSDHYTVAAYRRAIERACDQAFPLPEELRPNTAHISPVKKAKLLKTWGVERYQSHHAKVQAHFQQYRWHPNQLRHNAGTMIQDTFDLLASQRVLGHQKPETTRIYAKLRFEKAAEIMKAVG